MKTIFYLFILTIGLSIGYADVWIDGYYRRDGTYVKGHYRSSPDSSVSNNWSTKGNVNPYTGEKGTRTYGGKSTSTYPISSTNQHSTYKDTKRQFGAIALVIGIPLLTLLFLFSPSN